MKAPFFRFSPWLLSLFFSLLLSSATVGEGIPRQPAVRSLPTESPPVARNQPAERDGAYYLVGGSFRRKETAEEVCRKVRKKGEAAKVQLVTDSVTGTWNRVLIGPYPNRREALAKGQFLQQEGILRDFLILPPRPGPATPPDHPKTALPASPGLTDIRVVYREEVTRIFFQMQEKSLPQVKVMEGRDGPVLEVLLPLTSAFPLAGRIHGETPSFRSIRCDALSQIPPQTMVRIFLHPDQKYDIRQEYFELDKTLVLSLRLE